MKRKAKRATRRRKLVVGHLEKVSGQLFEEYPRVIKELIKGKSGVYALYKNDSLYYVGLASDLVTRLKAHLRDRHNRKWNRFSVYLTVHDDHMKEMESLMLRIASPSGNAQGGRFSGSRKLSGELLDAIKSEEADRRARIFGGRMESRRIRRKANNARGGAILAGVLDRRIQLKGWQKGVEYRARLRRDGRISFDGQLHDSPSSAGKAARGQATNGWTFWHFRDSRGEWVRLNRMKR